MQQAVEALERQLRGVRTGRATPALVEHVPVDYYGVPTPMNQLATVTAPEARLLVIQPWDRSALAAVEKAILRSDLSLTPTNDGSVVRLSLPVLTEDRRKDMVKLVHRKTEESRVATRNVRRDVNDKLRGAEKAKELSQDELAAAQDQLQKLTDSIISQMDQRATAKEAEVLEV
jgi:ribosome recycling factor